MKRFACVMIMVAATFASMAQEKAPNAVRAVDMLAKKQFAEAKAIVDQVPVHEKTKLDPKAWFHRAIVYCALDTAKGFAKGTEGYTETGIKAFNTADSLAGPKASRLSAFDKNSGVAISRANLEMAFRNVFITRGDNAFKNEQFEESMVQLDKSLAIQKDTLIYLYAAAAAQNANNADRAISYLDQYLDGGGKDPQSIQRKISLIYVEKKDYERALVDIRKAQKQNPQDSWLIEMELQCLLDLTRYDEAGKTVDQMMKTKPNDVKLIMLKGNLLDATDKPAEATEQYRRARELDPSNFDANAMMAEYATKEYRRVKQQMDVLDPKKDSKKMFEMDKL
ncbi:MAG: tetratricopeptide repeat protein, partial [Bacteroidota bacterium]